MPDPVDQTTKNVPAQASQGTPFNPPTINTVKVQLPSEPPPEALKGTFTDDPSLYSSEGDIKVVAEDKTGNVTPVKEVEVLPAPNKEVEKKAEEKVKEEPKTEDKARDEMGKFIKPPKKEGEKKEEVKVEEKSKIAQIKVPEKTVDAFDYSGYSDSEVHALKNMSRTSREFAVKLIKENKELAKAKGEVFYQSPDAYVLAPEYKELQEKAFYARQEARIFAEQLEQVKQVKPINKLLGWDAQGKPVFDTKETPVSGILEEELRNYYSEALRTVNGLSGKMQAFPDQYKAKISQDIGTITNYRKQQFAWAADPTLEDHTIEVGGEDVPIKTIRQNVINMLPPYLRNNPAADLCADAIVAINIQGAALREAQNALQVKEVQKKEQERIEPTSNEKVPVKSANDGMFSAVGMPE